jgi:hypothetical protein
MRATVGPGPSGFLYSRLMLSVTVCSVRQALTEVDLNANSAVVEFRHWVHYGTALTSAR